MSTHGAGRGSHRGPNLEPAEEVLQLQCRTSLVCGVGDEHLHAAQVDVYLPV